MTSSSREWSSSPPKDAHELHDGANSRPGSVNNHQLLETGEHATPVDEKVEDESNYLGAGGIALLTLAIALAVFLVSLDRTIVATAIPRITDQFHSFADIGWYASAYALAGCAMQLPLGRLYSFYSAKWIFISQIAIFEIGSAICAGAFNSKTIIIGRAVQGIGCAGVFSGSMILLVDNVRMQTRPMVMGVLMAIMSFSAIIGPLLGGVLTDKASWRWCFIINIPIGFVTLVILLFIVKATPAKEQAKSTLDKLKHLDPIGAALLIPAVICLILALQWGGSEYAWGSWRIVLLLVVSGLLSIAFAAVQISMPDVATVAPRIVSQRTVASSIYYATCSGGAMMVIVYWIPTWFQAIKNASPVKSGEMTIPLLVSQSLGSIVSGVLVSQVIGYASPFMLASSILMAVGAGLLSTLTITAGAGKWIGYQVIFGFGLGLGMQLPSTAIQPILAKEDLPSAISLNFFGMQLGGAIAICIGQNVLNSGLIKYLTQAHIPGVNPMVILHTGALDIKNLAGTAAEKTQLLLAYNHSLTNVFYVATALGAISIIGALFVEWKSVKGMKPGGH